jgi:hypothetical protein
VQRGAGRTPTPQHASHPLRRVRRGARRVLSR